VLKSENCTLYSGGHEGAESAFGAAAEKWGVNEINYIFAGQTPARNRNARLLTEEELKRGDISMELASRMMDRTYYHADRIRKVLQTIFHMVNSGHQIFVVGTILDDNRVKGGTGWTVELAKLFNRPLAVYDQRQQRWFTWQHGTWEDTPPAIAYDTFVGTGTRRLTEDGQYAIEKLFTDAFGRP